MRTVGYCPKSLNCSGIAGNRTKRDENMSWKEELGDYSESEFLSSKDLSTGIIKAIITGFSKTEFKEEDRFVLSMKDMKPLLLNKTNSKMLREIGETKKIDELIGRTVSLMKQKVNFQGDLVDAVRIVDLE